MQLVACNPKVAVVQTSNGAQHPIRPPTDYYFCVDGWSCAATVANFEDVDLYVTAQPRTISGRLVGHDGVKISLWNRLMFDICDDCTRLKIKTGYGYLSRERTYILRDIKAPEGLLWSFWEGSTLFCLRPHLGRYETSREHALTEIDRMTTMLVGHDAWLRRPADSLTFEPGNLTVFLREP